MLSTGEIHLIADEIMKRFARLDRFNQESNKPCIDDYVSTIIASLTEQCNALREERDTLKKLIGELNDIN